MKKCQSSTLWTWAWLVCAAAMPSFAQDSQTPKENNKPSAQDDAQMMATMMEMARPGENHKLLQETAGTWNYKVKWWMNPAAPPMESTGICSTKAVMDGRYFISDHTGKMSMPGPDGKMMDMSFLGMGTEGYDNAKKKYVASWIDNMGTGIMLMEGTYDPATKTLTYVGEEEPMPGVKLKVRQVIKYIDKDHRTIEFYQTQGAGEIKLMEMSYTRSV